MAPSRNLETTLAAESAGDRPQGTPESAVQPEAMPVPSRAGLRAIWSAEAEARPCVDEREEGAATPS